MPVSDKQFETILRYFDGELTAAEEQQLLQQLEQDIALQQAFDQQVMMRQFAPEQPLEISKAEPEPAEAFMSRVEQAMTDGNRPAPVIAIKKKRAWLQVAAAAVMLCLLAALVYYYLLPGKPGKELVKRPPRDSSALVNKIPIVPKDSIAGVKKQEQVNTVLLQQLYADNYALLSSTGMDVPVAAEEYRQFYEQRSYARLVKMNENELMVKGQEDSDEEQLTLDYFRLYKALASLETGKLPQAEKPLQTLANRSATPQIGYTAKWYLLLLYVKEEDWAKAMAAADLLTADAKNPYYKKALRLKEDLQKR